MSVLTAIVQALLQAVCRILPISESAHSALFHDFSGRYSGACSALTGIVHIGIAIGIVLAMYKLFLSLSKEFVFTIGDIFKKQLKIQNTGAARSFMYMTVLSFVPMLLWLIPCGDKGLFYSVLRSGQYNQTTLDDGLMLAVTGALLLIASRQIAISQNNKNVSELGATVIGFAAVLLVPVSGLSLVAGAFCILIFFGVSKKIAFRYGLVLSVPVLIVMGIIEICVSVTSVGIVSVIIGLLVSIVVSFVCVKLLRFIINTNKLKYFGIYDIGLGIIVSIVGIFELALR